MSARRWFWTMAVAVAAVLAWASAASAAEVDCLKCHRGLSRQKVVHAAMQMGCVTCHFGAVDAAVVPHRITGKVAKGLTSEQGELCLTCHHKAKFAKKVVHAPLGMGCTACHDPHASANEKWLAAAVPAL